MRSFIKLIARLVVFAIAAVLAFTIVSKTKSSQGRSLVGTDDGKRYSIDVNDQTADGLVGAVAKTLGVEIVFVKTPHVDPLTYDFTLRNVSRVEMLHELSMSLRQTIGQESPTARYKLYEDFQRGVRFGAPLSEESFVATAPDRSKPVQVCTLTFSRSNSVSGIDRERNRLQLDVLVTDPEGAFIATKPVFKLVEGKDDRGNVLKEEPPWPFEEEWLSGHDLSSTTTFFISNLNAQATRLPTLKGELVYKRVGTKSKLKLQNFDSPQRIEVGSVRVEVAAARREGRGWFFAFSARRPAKMKVEAFKSWTRAFAGTLRSADLHAAGDDKIVWKGVKSSTSIGKDKATWDRQVQPETPLDGETPLIESMDLTVTDSGKEIRLPLDLSGRGLP